MEINSTCYNIWNSYCNFEGFLSSLVQWFNLVRLLAFVLVLVLAYEDLEKSEFELIFSLIYFYDLLLVDLQIPSSQK